ncbi:MAG TPA: HypC/HybG/HupF family hydrogenase formation chaperone [Synergistales bacterium]|nr:HypC/HybG/HupF family hydrogenase formation chaperone [Synergistales bacterium]
MCLAIPYRIIELLDGNRAFASTGNVRTEVRTDLVRDLEVGDPVLVHAGFVIEKIDQDYSEELESLWSQIRDLAAGDQ